MQHTDWYSKSLLQLDLTRSPELTPSHKKRWHKSSWPTRRLPPTSYNLAQSISYWSSASSVNKFFVLQCDLSLQLTMLRLKSLRRCLIDGVNHLRNLWDESSSFGIYRSQPTLSTEPMWDQITDYRKGWLKKGYRLEITEMITERMWDYITEVMWDQTIEGINSIGGNGTICLPTWCSTVILNKFKIKLNLIVHTGLWSSWAFFNHEMDVRSDIHTDIHTDRHRHICCIVNKISQYTDWYSKFLL